MPELCLYDTLVIDPHSNFDPNDCNSLNQTHAYVSLGEVALDAPYIKLIRPEWIIGKNKAWNNNLVIDQTQIAWQTFFITKIITPLWNKGYRGFFFDTTDSYWLAVHNPLLQQKQIDSMASLIHQIKQRYPEASIILNRGFNLLPQVRRDINAVVIESIHHGWNQQKQVYETTSVKEQSLLLTEISKLRAMNLPIIGLDYLPPSQQDKAQTLANQMTQEGLIPWISDNKLQQIYLHKPFKQSRNILVIYSEEKTAPISSSAVLRYVGPIVEYMGYIPTYLELNAAKLSALKTQYAGVIFWLGTQSADNAWLLNWVQTQIAANIPVVFLSSFGVPIETKALAKLGLSIGTYKHSSASLEITKKDSTSVGYEVSPSITPYNFYPLRHLASKILLQLRNSHHQTEDAVAITPWGGYALSPFVIQFLPDNSALWVINPFEFFQQALRLTPFPVPDTTTENGRRLMSVHIDGDGFASPAKWVGGGFAARELRDKILKQFPIPTSLSLTKAEIAPDKVSRSYSKELIAIAQSLFALPWVESASYSFNRINNTAIDKHHPSITGIRPMGLALNEQQQVFAPIDADFYYMHDLAGPLYGFERVIETLQLTDKPRRFKPIGLYYHIYSASYPASLQALIKVYHWALAQSVMNVYSSDYIKKVLDFYQIVIAKHQGSWIIYSKGDLRELRIAKTQGYPDLIHSDNVIGFNEHEDARYIHLGPKRLSVLTYQLEKPVEPYLVEANARVVAFSRHKKQLIIRFRGNMPLQFTLANVSQCSMVSKPALKMMHQRDGTVRYWSSKDSLEIYINC